MWSGSPVSPRPLSFAAGQVKFEILRVSPLGLARGRFFAPLKRTRGFRMTSDNDNEERSPLTLLNSAC